MKYSPRKKCPKFFIKINRKEIINNPSTQINATLFQSTSKLTRTLLKDGIFYSKLGPVLLAWCNRYQSFDSSEKSLTIRQFCLLTTWIMNEPDRQASARIISRGENFVGGMIGKPDERKFGGNYISVYRPATFPLKLAKIWRIIGIVGDKCWWNYNLPLIASVKVVVFYMKQKYSMFHVAICVFWLKKFVIFLESGLIANCLTKFVEQLLFRLLY